MASQLRYKPRVRLPCLAPPAPAPSPRSRWWLWSLLLWALAVGIAWYLVQDGWRGATTDPADPSPLAEVAPTPTLSPDQGPTTSPGLDQHQEPQPDVDYNQESPGTPGDPPTCEVALAGLSEEPPQPPDYGTDLTRSTWGRVQNGGEWAASCRGPHPDRLSLCVVVRSGRVLGLSVHSDRDHAATEECIKKAILKMVFVEDSTPRILRTTLLLNR